MRESVTLRRKPKGAPKGKAKLLEFSKDLDSYLVRQSKKEGKTMVYFLSELLLFRRQLKELPKVGGK